MSVRSLDLDQAVEQALHALKTSGTRELPISRVQRLVKVSSLAVRAATRLGGAKLGELAGRKTPRAAQLKAAVEMVRTLGEMKGLAMKLGQMLSYADAAIPEEFRRILSVLQTQSQPAPFQQVRSLLEQELCAPLEQLFSRFEPLPIAVASIGQVHRATTRKDGKLVAVKVQHRQIESALRADLDGAQFGSRLLSLILPHADAESAASELRERFLEECDYLREAAWQKRFGTAYAGHPSIVIPQVLDDLTSRRVLTSEFVHGHTLREWLAAEPSQLERNRAGHALCLFYVGTLYTHGIFNADPHPGNILFSQDGRIALLDYGCVRAYEPEYVETLIRLLHAVLADDRAAIHGALLDAGVMVPDQDYDHDAARELMRFLYAPVLDSGAAPIRRGQTSGVLARYLGNQNLFKMRMPREMLFLNRVQFGLLSMLAELGCVVNWRGLTMDCIAQRRRSEAELAATLF